MTQKKLHKLQDEVIKCDYCLISKPINKIQASPTTAICVDCAEKQAEKKELIANIDDEALIDLYNFLIKELINRGVLAE